MSNTVPAGGGAMAAATVNVDAGTTVLLPVVILPWIGMRVSDLLH